MSALGITGDGDGQGICSTQGKGGGVNAADSGNSCCNTQGDGIRCNGVVVDITVIGSGEAIATNSSAGNGADICGGGPGD